MHRADWRRKAQPLQFESGKPEAGRRRSSALGHESGFTVRGEQRRHALHSMAWLCMIFMTWSMQESFVCAGPWWQPEVLSCMHGCVRFRPSTSFAMVVVVGQGKVIMHKQVKVRVCVQHGGE